MDSTLALVTQVEPNTGQLQNAEAGGGRREQLLGAQRVASAGSNAQRAAKAVLAKLAFDGFDLPTRRNQLSRIANG